MMRPEASMMGLCRGSEGLQGVTGGYEGVARGYKGSQGAMEGLQGAARGTHLMRARTCGA